MHSVTGQNKSALTGLAAVTGVLLLFLLGACLLAMLVGCSTEPSSPQNSSQALSSQADTMSSQSPEQSDQSTEESSSASSDSATDDNKLVIIHTDIGGSVKAARPDNNDDSEGVLGVAAVAALVHDYELSGYQTLVLEAGDALTGSELSMLTKGQAVVKAMNLAGFDASGLGTDDFSWGLDSLIDLSDEADFLVLAANVVRGEGANQVFRAHRVFDFDTMKVGVFGLCDPKTALMFAPSLLGDARFLSGEEMYTCAQEEIDYLNAQGCDLIVCIGRMGTDEASEESGAQDIIEHTSGIDLFITGGGNAPESKTVQGTLLVEAGNQLSGIGIVLMGEDGLNSNIVEFGTYDGIDSQVTLAVQQMEQDSLADLEEEVGKAQIEVLHETIANTYSFIEEKILEGSSNETQSVEVTTEARNDTVTGPSRDITTDTSDEQESQVVALDRETPLGDLVADAFLWKARQVQGDNLPVDAALVPSGMIASDIKAGSITMADIRQVLPYDQRLCTLQLTGAQLRAALGAATSISPEPTEHFPQVAGIEMQIDTITPFALADPGARVTITKVGEKEFADDAVYTLVTVENTAQGGGAYTALKAASPSMQLIGAYDYETLAQFIETLPARTIGQDYQKAGERVLVAVE